MSDEYQQMIIWLKKGQHLKSDETFVIETKKRMIGTHHIEVLDNYDVMFHDMEEAIQDGEIYTPNKVERHDIMVA